MTEAKHRSLNERMNSDNVTQLLREFPQLVWRRKFYVLASLVISLALGAAYLYTATPVYEITARVVVQKQGVTLQLNRPIEVNDQDYLATQAQIMRSPMIIASALESVSYSIPEKPGEDPVTLILDSLTVDPVRGTNVLNLRFVSPTPRQALELVEAIVASYRKFQEEETLRFLGRLGDAPKVQEELWQAQVRAQELMETAGPRHPELRAVHEQIATWENLLAARQRSDQAVAEHQARERVRVIDGPLASDEPVWPRTSILLVACVVIGLGGGLGLICILERVDVSVRSSEQVRSVLELPVVGHIPPLAAPRSTRLGAIYLSRICREAPSSPGAEAFRTLRTRVAFGANSGSAQVLQISSPRENDGKTTVTGNLALSFAQLGKRVVVVDADLRCGELHHVFDVPIARGLKAVLCDGLPVEQAIEHSPLGVDVLPRGTGIANPGELIAQPAFEKVLEQLRQRYDVVLIDTPPLLLVSEGIVLARSVDGVLLTLTHGKSLLGDATRARELLESVAARVIGVVVNQSDDITQNGYYFHHSRYGNGHASAPMLAQQLNGSGHAVRN